MRILDVLAFTKFSVHACTAVFVHVPACVDLYYIQCLRVVLLYLFMFLYVHVRMLVILHAHRHKIKMSNK